jgi:hypothetical protein
VDGRHPLMRNRALQADRKIVDGDAAHQRRSRESVIVSIGLSDCDRIIQKPRPGEQPAWCPPLPRFLQRARRASLPGTVGREGAQCILAGASLVVPARHCVGLRCVLFVPPPLPFVVCPGSPPSALLCSRERQVAEPATSERNTHHTTQTDEERAPTTQKGGPTERLSWTAPGQLRTS